MTTSNGVTLDHINSFFSLDGQLEKINIATATGGAGIDNRSKFPPPKPSVPSWRKLGTGYAKKYLDKEKDEQSMPRRQTLEIPGGSTISINTLEDVEDTSTIPFSLPAVNDLQKESFKHIYATYFRDDTITYDPDLTITSYRDEILQQLEINPVLIIQGPTGCGKTTQVPQYILDHYRSRGAYCKIVVTQPRKIAAISIATRVSYERKWELGSIVGYQVAMEAKVGPDTCISYVTTGVLLEKLVNAKRMDMYTHIIIDEVHERNQDIDFALLLVKKFLKMNSPRVKVILMSATFDSTAFSKYFSLYEKSGPAPVIDIIGKSKEVSEYYANDLYPLIDKMPEYDLNNPMIEPCLYETVSKLLVIFDKIEKDEQDIPPEERFAPIRGAVLIFLPGYDEISIMTNKLEAAGSLKNFFVIPLHSSITVKEQERAFDNPPPDHRKIIISTNIAESSITVPDIKYVIDFCLTKSLITDPVTNYTCLQLEWASKANCIQRKGRAGRVDIGKIYRLVTRQFYEELPEYGIPEIKRCPLNKTILHLKKLNLCEPQEMLAFSLDPPDLSDIANAIVQLKEALALTSRRNNPFDGDLTFIGRVMSNLPLDIKLSKLIIFGYVFHCLEECIVIAASMSLQSFFARPFQRALDAYRSRLAWDENTFSDCLVYLNAYLMWKELKQQGRFNKRCGMNEYEWASVNFIQIKRIKEVDRLVSEIKSRLERLQIRSDSRPHRQGEKSILILKMVIAGAFFPHYFLQEPLDEKTIMRDINDNDPHSAVTISGLPKHGILYASAIKDMLSCCGENVMIEFDNNKAYIKFGNNVNNSSSGVLQAVYLAVKIRKLRMPLELEVFSQEEAEQKSLQILESKRQSGENRLISNRITVKLNSELKLEKAYMPPLEKTMIRIFISQLIDCGTFWARILNSQTNKQLRFLDFTINYGKGKNLKPLTKPPVVNGLYLAPFVEGRGEKEYYRAQVLQLHKQNLVDVFFIDYGNTETVKVIELMEIDEKTPDVLTTPPLAVKCSLSEIKPIKSAAGEWSARAISWMKEEINGKELDAMVYSVVQDQIRLQLMIKDKRGFTQIVNDQLVKMGFAEFAEESLASKQNHELRNKATSYTSCEVISENPLKEVEVSWEEAESCTYLHKTGRKVKLHGPYNPLEVSYSGLTSADRTKCVKIERDSVNSVSFNAEPQEPYHSMLVAASIGIGQSSRDLIARNTTLMPKIRGLPTLVCLLFTPCAEIRTDKDRSCYIGAICGLGFDKQTSESFYPDHDIELTFDIDISLEDIREINAIRMGINLLLHSQSDILQYESSHAHNVHEKTRRTVLKLLQRNWKPKEPKYFRNPYYWNQIPSELLLDTGVDQSADHPDVLPLHRPPSLSTFQNKRLLEHLDKLYSLVDRTPSNDFKLIRCELCSEDLTSERDLLVHLDSLKHQNKEKLLKE